MPLDTDFPKTGTSPASSAQGWQMPIQLMTGGTDERMIFPSTRSVHCTVTFPAEALHSMRMRTRSSSRTRIADWLSQ